MKLFEKKETKLQREMEKYTKKMRKLNCQLDNLNAEVMKKTKFKQDVNLLRNEREWCAWN